VIFPIQQAMSNEQYHEILEKEKKNTANFSNRAFHFYLQLHHVLRFFYSELLIWLFTLSPFVLFAIIFGPNFYLFLISVHFFLWIFFGKEKYYEMCDEHHDDVVELELTITILKDLQKERAVDNNVKL
jgi:hypothetical protein